MLIAQATVSEWVTIVTQIGVPAAILGLVFYFGLPYHARVVKEKDAEISRINEARVKDAEARADKQAARDEKFLTLLQEVHEALNLLNERIRGGKP